MKCTIPMVLTAALLASCATQPNLLKTTESGYPEVVLANTSVDAAAAAIRARCNTMHMFLRAADAHQVVCVKPVAYNTPLYAGLTATDPASAPHAVVKTVFTLHDVGAGVKVIARQWAETARNTHQIGGLSQTIQLNDAQHRNAMQRFLSALPATK